MKKTYLRQVFIVFFLLSISILPAQTDSTKNELNLDFGADFMSRYIWRGTQFGGNSPNIQPSLVLTYKNLELGAWGAYSTGGVHASQEFDLYLSYTFFNEMFTFIATDYYFPSDTANYDYLGYDDKTGHILEIGMLFNGTKKIPISLSGYVNIIGDDAPTIGANPNDTANFNKETGIQYSNYFEIAYNRELKNNVDISLFLGFSFNNPKTANKNTGYIGENGFYGTGAGVVNIGIQANKSIRITDKYSLPITTSLILNPQSEKIFFVFGISF